MSAVTKVPVRMTLREFLIWDPGDGRQYELVDGEPRAMAPASTIHGLLQTRLARLIGNHLLERRSNCEVVGNPGVIPRLFSEHNARIPDLGVTCSPVLPGQAVLPDPVLLIEILSPSNQADTWSNVWAYTSIPTVQEILILRSDRIAAELLRRTPDGTWPEEPQEITAGTLELASIGFAVALATLYERTGLTA
ncbi:MAG: Uma2 family endonuclease [Acetobacteraceae bacterium]